jgi:hypothetical protein
MIENLINIQVDLKNHQYILPMYQHPKPLPQRQIEVIQVKNVRFHLRINLIIIVHLQLINPNNTHHLILSPINTTNPKKHLYIKYLILCNKKKLIFLSSSQKILTVQHHRIHLIMIVVQHIKMNNVYDMKKKYLNVSNMFNIKKKKKSKNNNDI